jgi:hypothetical protein
VRSVTAEESVSRVALSPSVTNGKATVTDGEKTRRRPFSPTVTDWQEHAEKLARFREDCRRRNRLHDLADRTGSVCERCEAEIGPDKPLWRVWNRVPTVPYRGRWCLLTYCAPCGSEWQERLTFDRRYLLESVCEECGRPVVFGLVLPHRRFFCSRSCANKHYARPHNARRAEQRAAQRANSTCAQCGHAFNPSRSDARYCSPACRQTAYRAAGSKRPITTPRTAR